jgi:hypothetical protein
MPEVTSTTAPPGGTIGATVAAENGDLVALLIAQPGPPASVPGLGRFWLDPATVSLHTVGLQQPGSPVIGAIAVPMTPTLRGATVAWQAIAFATGGVAVTNASMGFVE